MVPEEVEFVIAKEQQIVPSEIKSPVATEPPPIEEPAKAQSHECPLVLL